MSGPCKHPVSYICMHILCYVHESGSQRQIIIASEVPIRMHLGIGVTRKATELSASANRSATKQDTQEAAPVS